MQCLNHREASSPVSTLTGVAAKALESSVPSGRILKPGFKP